jgi:type II secretion system protein H
MSSGRKSHRSLSLSGRRARADAGFTLIELMAVVAIMTMIFALGVPRLGSSQWRALREEAETIAMSIEFARQRAIMTAIPHRLLVDLEEGGYRVEWLVSEEQAFAALTGESTAFAEEEALFGSDAEAEDALLELRPPARAELDFHPVPNRQLGSFTWIDDALYFVGLENSGGWIEGGDVSIRFEADGTTEYSLLEIADTDDNHMTLVIEPLLDRVRRRSGPARS